MDSSKEFQLMLDEAIKSEPLTFRGFDRTKNVQDQLQKILKEPLWDIMGNFLEWYLEHPEIETNARVVGKTFYCEGYLGSMEQLWLAFVMKEKYNKVWTGEEWVS